MFGMKTHKEIHRFITNGSCKSALIVCTLAATFCIIDVAGGITSIPNIINDVNNASQVGVTQPQLLLRKRRYPGNANRAEFVFCIQPWHWRKCRKAKRHANEATQEAERRYPGTLHNGNGDAFRHCYWSARMTRDMGERQARRFGDRHEKSRQPQLEKEMDVFNNSVGRTVGRSQGNYQSDIKKCEQLVVIGSLRINNGRALIPSG